jgi:hypothetical protein
VLQHVISYASRSFPACTALTWVGPTCAVGAEQNKRELRARKKAFAGGAYTHGPEWWRQGTR